MMARILSVLRLFPSSAVRPGITYLSVHPVSWTEPTVLEREFKPGVTPEEAIEIASEFAHDDYALVFEAFWDLWVPNEDEHGDSWTERPVPVRFLVHGVQFDEGTYADDGHIEIDFGIDSPFLSDDAESAAEKHVKINIARLIGFSSTIEKSAAVSGRVLWSESDDDLAQKLIAQLQKTQ